MRTVWQMIDGKRTWKEILNTNFQYNTQEKNQSIYKIISQIFKNNWGSIEQSNHKNRDIVIHEIFDQQFDESRVLYADPPGYDPYGGPAADD